MKYIIYKTATTGLWDWSSPVESDTQPRLVQLAWGLYNGGTLKSDGSYVILLPEGESVPEAASKIHGVTTEVMRANGVPLKGVLSKFRADYEMADQWMVYNYPFDLDVVTKACVDADVDRIQTWRLGIPGVDLMKKAALVLRIPGNYGHFKSPNMKVAYEGITGREWGVPTLLEVVHKFNEIVRVFGEATE